ncbi:hypothetical protein SNE40_004949 [Patella caerulea]|uniref:Uncharacterized protein n=1 Tax=Patella caerulea TaxID=87958 RepID=A0AAN8PXT8_PATCE
MSSLANAPIGWASSRQIQHLRRVKPVRNQGTHETIHKNINKKFLPTGYIQGKKSLSQSHAEAENIVYRQKVRGRMGGLPLPEKEFYLVKVSYSDSESDDDEDESDEEWDDDGDDDSDSETLSDTTESEPPLPAVPGCRYTQRDIDNVVERLSSYDPANVPESRGYDKPKTTITINKQQTNSRYSEQHINNLVQRLSKPKYS